jgi:hypothetical protein
MLGVAMAASGSNPWLIPFAVAPLLLVPARSRCRSSRRGACRREQASPTHAASPSRC